MVVRRGRIGAALARMAPMTMQSTPFANQLLVALPSLADPNFERTVSLLCRHDNGGAMGVVVNRRSDYSLGEVFSQMGIACSDELDWCEDLLFNLEYIRHAERFASVSSPVYYYVKNPGSLVATRVRFRNAAGIVATRATLFGYYKKLYEELGLYEENRVQIHKYLVAVAEDA